MNRTRSSKPVGDDADRRAAREHAISAIAGRFEQDPQYLRRRRTFDAKIKTLVTAGRLSRAEAQELEELVFSQELAAADCVAGAWYDAAAQSLMPDLVVRTN